MKAQTINNNTPQPEIMPHIPPHDEMLSRIGHVTRALHDNLSGLGFDKMLEQVASEIPDARDRLNYVARMTEQAAERVLNATDEATPLQTELSTEGAKLGQQWQAILDKPSLKSEYNEVVKETLAFLALTEKNTAATKALLMDIMMAQDFQDLTGQVIKKIVEMSQKLESGLLQVLIEVMPAEKRAAAPEGLLNGPVINAQGRNDVVTSQEQVDDLLESLGF